MDVGVGPISARASGSIDSDGGWQFTGGGAKAKVAEGGGLGGFIGYAGALDVTLTPNSVLNFFKGNVLTIEGPNSRK